MKGECEKLDLFLSGELLDEDALRFESHIVECEACRDAIDQQLWIDGLLRSPTRLEIEPSPSDITKTVRHSILSHRRKVRLAACGLAAAAAFLVAGGWIALLNRQASDATDGGITTAMIPETKRFPAPTIKGRRIAEPPRAVFVGGANVFVAAVESRHPNVTIVRLYPTYKPSFASKPSAESSDAEEFNGG
jgi:hypothetical protein